MIYAIDFDGTIVENAFPKIGKLIPEAKAFIQKLKANGDKWILYTMREGDVLVEALEFLQEQGIYPDEVNDNLPEMCEFYHNNPRKVFANYYIDDHNADQFMAPWIYKNPLSKFMNTYLISAAPDMLEALAEAVERYGKPGGPWNVPSEPGSWIAKAKAALKKARGEA